MYELFNGCRDTIEHLALRNTRGCGVAPISGGAITPSDRCYASVVFNDFKASNDALKSYDPNDPPIIRGLPAVIGLSPADMPDFEEILERTLGLLPGSKIKYVDIVRLFAQMFADDRLRCTKKQIPRRIATQKTELVIEDQPRPLAGPSRRSAQQKRK